jgi:hypothetical protein
VIDAVEQKGPAMRVVSTVLGVVLVLATWLSIHRTVFTPRYQASFMGRWTSRAVSGIMLPAARMLPEPARESFLAYAAPLMLFSMGVLWLIAEVAGFCLLAWGVSDVAFNAQGLSGFFSLRSAAAVLAAAAWLSSVLLVATFSVHLVRVTSAYSRRERLIGRLAAQATHAPDAETVFVEYARGGSHDQLGALFEEWSNWLADVEATHLAYPALVYYRSVGEVCWTGAAQIMLDCAALAEACAPGWAPPQTRALLNVGEHCLPRIAARLGINLPPVPVSYQGREMHPFSRTLSQIREAGLPIEPNEDHVQSAFQRLRVRYAPFANAICERLLYEIKDL